MIPAVIPAGLLFCLAAAASAVRPSNTPVYITAFVVGAAVGSFVNVVIYRLPRGMSLLRPPSHCPSCGARLGPLELIPILGWVLLLGRCRHCRQPISPRYPLVELICALLFLGAFYYNGPGLVAFALCAVFAALVVAFFVDLDHMIIPDEVHWVIAAGGVAINIHDILLRRPEAIVLVRDIVGSRVVSIAVPSCIIGAAVAGGGFVLLAYLAQLAFKRPALGMGDVKLAAALGTLFGPGLRLLSFFLLAVFIGAAIGMVLLALRGRKASYVPFGPMLAASAIATAMWPQQVTWLVAGRLWPV